MSLFDGLFGRKPEPTSSWEKEWRSPDADAFDEIQEAESLFEQGRVEDAETGYIDGVAMYRRAGDNDGVAYALGRFGEFYLRTNRPDQALELLQEALDLGTDIPAIYYDLLNVLAEKGESNRLFHVAQMFCDLPHGNPFYILRSLITLAVNRAPTQELTIDWLKRIETWAEAIGEKAIRFEALGRRAQVHEKAGEIALACSMYEEAIAAGSSDRLTYTRLLMAYEKSKRWDELLNLAERGLQVQQDAAWEQDLLKRIERAKIKSGAIRKTDRTIIPAFSIRQGQDRVGLVSQVDISPPARNLAVSPDSRIALISCASSKAPNLLLYDLAKNEVTWRAAVNGSSAEVFVVGDKYVAATSSGRVGDGSAEFTILGAEGQTVASWNLPDKVTEVRVTSNQVIAGCCDGFLYSHDLAGMARWNYQVPSRDDVDADNPYSRPCPYYLSVSPEGDHVLFSSWDQVFMLNGAGKLQWKWRTESKDQKFRYSIPLDSNRSSLDYYRVLGVTSSATEDEIRRAFRQKAFETHPDHHPEDSTGKLFKEVVQAYEAIASGVAKQRENNLDLAIEITFNSGPNSVSSVVTGPGGEKSLVTSSDGHLALLDGRGNLLHTLVCGEHSGTLSASTDLERFVYSHWAGLNFYSATSGLLNVYLADEFYQVKMRPDGGRLLAWRDRKLLSFDVSGRLIAEIEFARTIGSAEFLDGNEILVTTGKLIRLRLD